MAAQGDECLAWRTIDKTLHTRTSGCETLMGKGRLEAFSDGVIAVIITITVLELRAPHGGAIEALAPVLPVFLSYVLSFIYVGIYWNNHHHLLYATSTVTGGMLWANLHLLFWLSLIPFATDFMGESHFAPASVGLYGVVLLMAAVAYWLLQQLIVASQGAKSILKKVLGSDWKGKASPILYTVAIATAFELPWLSLAIYASVALVWLIPDKRIARTLVLQQADQLKNARFPELPVRERSPCVTRSANSYQEFEGVGRS
jgi:uncharacterized membrane protein